MARTKQSNYAYFGWKRMLPIGLIIFALIFFRYCYYGFYYFPQAGGYVQQYGGGTIQADLEVLLNGRVIFSLKPLAGLANFLVKLGPSGNPMWAVGVISALYAASAMLFYKVFRRRFGTGLLFLVIYALLPLNFEGAYWLPASTRLITAMFLASLSIYFFDIWCRRGGKSRLVVFAAAQFFCCCLSAQVMALSCALTVMIMIFCVEDRQGRGVWGFLMFASIGLWAILSAWSGLFGGHAVSGAQVWTAFRNGFWGICCGGLARGIWILLDAPNVFWTLSMLLLCMLLFFLVRDANRRDEFRFGREILWGLILMAAPFTVFFFMRDSGFGLMHLVPALCGLGLICDALFDLAFCHVTKGAFAQAVVIGLLALLFTFASVSVLHDYREASRTASFVPESSVASAHCCCINEFYL